MRREVSAEPIYLPRLLVEAGLAKSTSDVLRTIRQGGLEIDGVRAGEDQAKLDASSPSSRLVKFGKRRFLRVVVG